MNASVGLRAVPSTETVKGVDDFQHARAAAGAEIDGVPARDYRRLFKRCGVIFFAGRLSLSGFVSG